MVFWPGGDHSATVRWRNAATRHTARRQVGRMSASRLPAHDGVMLSDRAAVPGEHRGEHADANTPIPAIMRMAKTLA
jgi:hypothetical protein